jgi:hypothetical protein
MMFHEERRFRRANSELVVGDAGQLRQTCEFTQKRGDQSTTIKNSLAV